MKTIWTANIAPEKGTYLRYKVIFEQQLKQNGDSARENLQKDVEAHQKLDELDGDDLLCEDEKELKRQEIIATSHNIKTAAQYESLCRHYARKRAYPNAIQKLLYWLRVSRAQLHEDAIIWDTESDDMRGTHDLKLTREWGFMKLYTLESLHVFHGDPVAKTKILEFLHRANYLTEFEPKGCDRNRLQELLSPKEVHLICPKFTDFCRDLFDKFSTTNHMDKLRFIIQDEMQQTIGTNSRVEVVNLMNDNIAKVVQRGENLEQLQNKTDDLANSSLQFKRGASDVRKAMWWKDTKMKLIIGGIVALIIIIIIS
ncbi:UNVERIFIED_CONTAM: hypothetical protein HDU68_008254 [Siphonaria sp. JEL0065]|nr:hypothetical protein HDU68_008254 [Siphonaria sp. JEL0065]